MKKNVSQREAIIGKALLSYRVFDLTSKFHLRLEPCFLIVLTSNLLVLVIPDEIKERRKENGRKKKKMEDDTSGFRDSVLEVLHIFAHMPWPRSSHGSHGNAKRARK